MTKFTITEDFPKNEIEFDARFSNPKACYDYLLKQKWPNGFICKKGGHSKYWVSSRNLYICTQYLPWPHFLQIKPFGHFCLNK